MREVNQLNGLIGTDSIGELLHLIGPYFAPIYLQLIDRIVHADALGKQLGLLVIEGHTTDGQLCYRAVRMRQECSRRTQLVLSHLVPLQLQMVLSVVGPHKALVTPIKSCLVSRQHVELYHYLLSFFDY